MRWAVPQPSVQGGDLGTFVSTSGTEIELLLSESNLGGSEIQIGEITFPPGANSGGHLHGATEVFYVLEGELEHVVDGVSQILGPGDLGFVRPPLRGEPHHLAGRRAGPGPRDLGSRRRGDPHRRELAA